MFAGSSVRLEGCRILIDFIMYHELHFSRSRGLLAVIAVKSTGKCHAGWKGGGRARVQLNSLSPLPDRWNGKFVFRGKWRHLVPSRNTTDLIFSQTSIFYPDISPLVPTTFDVMLRIAKCMRPSPTFLTSTVNSTPQNTLLWIRPSNVLFVLLCSPSLPMLFCWPVLSPQRTCFPPPLPSVFRSSAVLPRSRQSVTAAASFCGSVVLLGKC